MGYIYKIINLINGKFYIGSTIRPLYIRKYGHFSELRNNEHCNKHLQRSFNKYGEENFKLEIIETLCFPEEYTKLHKVEYLVCRELYLVDLLGAEYNMRKDTTTGKTGYVHSEETRRKISIANKKEVVCSAVLHQRELAQMKKEGIIIRIGSKKGWKHKAEAIEKIKERSLQKDNKIRIREIQKIAAHNRIGTHQSSDTKVKGAITKFGKMRQIEVYTIKGNLLYSCNFAPEAVLLTGVKRSAISNNLAGISKSAGGLIFKYSNT